MNVTQYRQEIINQLGSAGIAVYAGGMRRQEPPYVQLYPAENYLERVDTNISASSYEVRATFNLSIIAGPEDKDTSFDHLDSLLTKAIWILRDEEEVEVSSFVAIDQNNNRILAANISFSNILTITQGEL